jgi:hypothetical protein
MTSPRFVRAVETKHAAIDSMRGQEELGGLAGADSILWFSMQYGELKTQDTNSKLRQKQAKMLWLAEGCKRNRTASFRADRRQHQHHRKPCPKSSSSIKWALNLQFTISCICTVPSSGSRAHVGEQPPTCSMAVSMDTSHRGGVCSTLTANVCTMHTSAQLRRYAINDAQH